MKSKKLNFKQKLELIHGFKGLATILFYWKFSNQNIPLTILVLSCSLALFFIKTDLSTKKSHTQNKFKSFEIEFFTLLLIILPLLSSIIDQLGTPLLELLKKDNIKMYVVDAFVTIIIGRITSLMKPQSTQLKHHEKEKKLFA